MIKEGATDIEKEINAPLVSKYGGTEFTHDMYIAEQAGDPYPGTGNVTELTDSSTPAMAWCYRGGYMNKPITDISEDTETKTISFKFMGGTGTGIIDIKTVPDEKRIYSLDGRYLGTDTSVLCKGIYIIDGKKICR